MNQPILLSPPHLSGKELALIGEALESNWIAPMGPQVDAFEREFARLLPGCHALALNSGTAALHLALITSGVGSGDEVFCSSLTFIASAGPVLYQGAIPVFIDSEPGTWNMDPNLLAKALKDRAARGRLPRAAIVVHLYGQSADLEPIQTLCDEYGVSLIEDAAQALGADYRGGPVGSFGKLAVFSFNSNKIITTSAGGMLVSRDKNLIEEARNLAMQAREPAPHYQHGRVGYNYRMSNLLAAVGRAQLEVLPQRVRTRRAHYRFYKENLEDLAGLRMKPEAGYGASTHWLSCVLIDEPRFGRDREFVRRALEQQCIETRPIFKPLHLQPAFEDCPRFGGQVSERIFEQGLCLPSGSALSEADRARVAAAIRATRTRAKPLSSG